MEEFIKTMRDFQLLDFFGSGQTLKWIPTIILIVCIVCILFTQMKVIFKFLISLAIIGGILIILGVIPVTF